MMRFDFWSAVGALAFLVTVSASGRAQPPPTASAQWAPAPPPSASYDDSVAPQDHAGDLAGEWRLSLQSEGAFGFSGSGFGNFLIGPRIDRYFSDRIAFGLSLDFVNLKGKDGRVKNVLPEARIEYRFPVSAEVALPITYGMGFLKNNGPTVHFTGGLELAVGDGWSVGIEAGPMGWFTHDELIWSGNAGLALGATL